MYKQPFVSNLRKSLTRKPDRSFLRRMRPWPRHWMTLKISWSRWERYTYYIYIDVCTYRMYSCCSPILSWSVSKWQAEKRLKAQLTSVEQQQVKALEGLKEKQNQLEKLQAQLQTVQGSFEVETKKLKGQIAELQENGAKKASRNLKCIQIHAPHQLLHMYVSTTLNICFYANLMFADVCVYHIYCRQKRKSSFGRRCQDWAKNWLPRSVVQQNCKRLWSKSRKIRASCSLTFTARSLKCLPCIKTWRCAWTDKCTLYGLI